MTTQAPLGDSYITGQVRSLQASGELIEELRDGRPPGKRRPR
jgi:hypothetical protein